MAHIKPELIERREKRLKNKVHKAMVRICSKVSAMPVTVPLSTAKKYPFNMVHIAIKGSPRLNILREEESFISPKSRSESKSERMYKIKATDKLKITAKMKQPFTVLFTAPLLSSAITVVTSLVTARLIPEVERVTAKVKTENISW